MVHQMVHTEHHHLALMVHTEHHPSGAMVLTEHHQVIHMVNTEHHQMVNTEHQGWCSLCTLMVFSEHPNL